ncbi:MAG: aldo/keto reductase [Candidatus Dadabacteria bacterium]
MITRKIPSTGELLPVIGLGTWKVFDVPATSKPDTLTSVLTTLYQQGGRLIDSSPMYGRSEEVIGEITCQLPSRDDYFYATKVWVQGEKEGIAQMESSMTRMKREVVDLMQIHNLLDWKKHLRTLRKWKEEGRIRYIGITHYTDGMHAALEDVIRAEKIDFVQFNYSIGDRHAEESLLPAARDYGVATIVNRPFTEGGLFSIVRGKQLPSWVAEFGINSWSQFFLKYILAHPAVTCVIPATSNPEHMLDNLLAADELLPGEAIRKKMVSTIREM